MIQPKHCEFSTQVFDYGHKTGTMIVIKIKNYRWRNAVMGPRGIAKDHLLQHFWRRLGAQ